MLSLWKDTTALCEAQDMLASLLRTENIPSELKRWVQNKTEGNPFYLEELVNTLIESEALIRENGDWKITRPIKETDISSSIHGLISGRLDRLEKETKRLLDYGERTSNSRSKVFGHFLNAYGHLAMGNMALARKESEKSIGSALDPLYAQFPKGTLGMSYFFNGQLKKAEETFELLLNFCEKREVGLLSGATNVFVATILIAHSNMKEGFKKFEETQEVLQKNHMKVFFGQSESILGVVYAQFITEPSPGLLKLVKNIGSIVKYAPFADRKAEEHFNKAIEICRETGAKWNL